MSQVGMGSGYLQIARVIILLYWHSKEQHLPKPTQK